MNFADSHVAKLIDLAIVEDIGDGDHSSLGAIPPNQKGRARLLVKDVGVICGIDLAAHIFNRLDSTLVFESLIEEGSVVNVGDIAFNISGNIHSILQAERLVLNFMQRMSGISTFTKRLVDIISGTNAQLLDTRKTTPGMRVFEKYAVSVGGGVNHRMGLYDMVMLKDNHNDYAGGITAGVNQTKSYLKSQNRQLKIEVESRNLEEVEEARVEEQKEALEEKN